MPIKFAATQFILCLILTGCSNSDSPQKVLILGEVYQEQPGDTYTEAFTLNTIFPNGQSTTVSSINVIIYSQISSIPPKYSYSNSNSGPFLLETTNTDGAPDNLKYMSITGEFIINDNLKYFTSIESTTEYGSKEPENIFLGDKFKYSKTSKLFNSQTGIEEGSFTINMNFTVLSEEQVTIPAGAFNAVKISYNVSTTNSINNFNDTTSGTGLVWFNSSNGIPLKIVMDGDITLGEQDISVSYSSETILQSFSISKPISSSKLNTSIAAGKTQPNYNINESFVFRTVEQNLNKAR